MTITSTAFDIDSPYPLTSEQMGFYRENGYVRLKNVFTPETLEYYRRAPTRQTDRAK